MDNFVLNINRLMKLLAVLFAVFLFLPANTFAVEVQDLYSAKLRIESQVRKDRNLAQRGALRQVLVKVSGSQNVLDHPLVKSQLSKATDYMHQYRFVNENGQQLLQATFEENKVNKLIRQAGFPIWGSRRPLIMVWLAIEDSEGYSRTLVADSDIGDEKTLLNIISEERGLPTVFPLMDFQEITEISVNDVWGRFYETLQNAGLRYAADIHLIARIFKDQTTQDQVRANEQPADVEPQPIKWVLEWVAMDGSEYFSDQHNGTDKPALVEQMIHSLGNVLAQRYAIEEQTEGQAELDIDVVNIASINQYVDAERFLKSLTAVADVQLLSVNGAQVKFRLRLVGQVEDVLSAIELDHRLSRQFDPLAASSEQAHFEFRWQP